MGKEYFIEGLPIDNNIKVLSVIFGTLALVINHNIALFSSALNYGLRDYVSLFILIIVVLISVGSKLAEGIVMGLSLFVVISAAYDLSVFDISELRKNIIIGGSIIIVISGLLGKISLANVFKGQLGLD